MGPQFNDRHKVFQAKYEELDDFVDDVAGRIRQLGGRSPGRLAEFTKAAFGDAGTGDFLTGLMEKHEKMVWMLRAFVEA